MDVAYKYVVQYPWINLILLIYSCFWLYYGSNGNKYNT